VLAGIFIITVFSGCSAQMENDTESTWCVGACSHVKTKTIEDTEKD
jgi:hypothetical protein